MSEALRGVVVCHGNLAEALIDAVERISGISGVLVAVSNSDCDRGDLQRRIQDAAGAGSAIVFTDLASGSCMIAAATQARETGTLSLVSGVNLPMLLDFVFHRDLPLAEAAARVAASGAKAIRVP